MQNTEHELIILLIQMPGTIHTHTHTHTHIHKSSHEADRGFQTAPKNPRPLLTLFKNSTQKPTNIPQMLQQLTG